ncbi:BMC domain-containing protein [Peptacetobacter sp.]|uniref:BMC domain-containing protein n=1 Tax=Peptacetobacter sp. TaxID=2991975 RepID=UPI00260A21FF|nr:BMC domain-containing protein [Peptacetobacter sp.]
MDFSVGIFEFPSIAKGYKNIDYIMKQFNISVIKIQKICPGRLLFIFSADTSDVKNILEEYKDNSEKILFTSACGVCKECIDILSKCNKIKNFSDLGILELRNSVNIIKAADIILKSSSSKILKLDIGLGLFGKGVIYFVGSVSNLESAINSIKSEIKSDDIISSQIISNPVDDFKKLFIF